MNILVGALPTLLIWVLFASSLTQCGRLLFQSIRYPFRDALEEGSFSFGLAAALFATAIWGVGLCGALNRPVVGALSAAVLAVGVLSFGSFVRWAASLARELRVTLGPQNGFERFLAAAAGLSFLVTLLATLSPQLGRDALAYHYYCPKEFILKGSLYAVPYSVNAFQPLLAQMLYLQGLLFHSELFGKLFNLGYLLMAAAAIGSCARLFEPKARGTAPALILFIASGLLTQTPYAYTDVALSFFLFLSFFALWRYFREPEPVFAGMSGLFVGVALAVKLLAVPAAAALFFLLLWQTISGVGRQKGRAVLYFMFFALLPCAGWYLRSWLATGNPIFPYFNQVFTGHPWASDIRDQTGIGRGFWALLKAPILFFVYPRPFGGGDSQIGVLILIASPLMATLSLKKGDKGRLAFLALFQFAFWFYLVQHYRFLFPLFPVLYLWAGVALEAFFSQKDAKRMVLKALIIGAIVLQTAFVLYYNGKLSRYLLLPSKDSYLRMTERSYASALWANENLPKDARLLMFNEPSQYYFDRPTAREDIVLGLEPELAQKSAGELLAVMKKRGFTHLLTRQLDGSGDSALMGAETTGRFRLLHEESFAYGRENCLVRLYEFV